MPLEVPLTSTEEITTPEGLVLRFRIAQAGERVAAFAVDLLMILLLFTVGVILAFLIGAATLFELGAVAAMIYVFFLRHWYFTFFELRGSGVTPGKRNQHLRVIARDGGPLTGEMIVARNLL